VELCRAAIPALARDCLAVAFPGSSAGLAPGDVACAAEPIALLSFASRGDMKFGDPARTANRESFLHEAGIDPENARGIELSHSRNVLFLDRDDDTAAMARAEGGADGLILRDPDMAATVTVADCMPIWLLDRGSGAFGLVHSGWRGTGILACAVRTMAERCGSKPSSIAVILGPAIGSCCYSVPEERAAEFASEFGPSAVDRREGAWFLDLRAANIAIAQRVGIGHLLSIEACTSCDERLGSFRRQGPASFTRMMAVCGRSTRVPDIYAEGKVE
jgi:YfiH family protein